MSGIMSEMKKLNVIAFLGVALAISLGFLVYRSQIQTAPRSKRPIASAQKLAREAIALQELAPRPAADPAPTSEESKCWESWKKLALQDFNRAARPEDFTGECFQQIPSVTKVISETCNKEDPASKNTCTSALMLVRVNAIDRLTRGKDIHELSDKVLVNKLLASFMDPKFTERVDELEKIADRLIELKPDLYAAYKGALTVEGIRVGGAKDPESVDLRKMERLTDQLLQFDVADSEVAEAILFPSVARKAMGKLNSDLDRLEATARDDGAMKNVVQYYRAYLEWKRNDLPRAQAMLEDLVRRVPTDERFRKTLEGVKAGDTEKEIFSVKFSASFDQL